MTITVLRERSVGWTQTTESSAESPLAGMGAVSTVGTTVAIWA